MLAGFLADSVIMLGFEVSDSFEDKFFQNKSYRLVKYYPDARNFVSVIFVLAIFFTASKAWCVLTSPVVP